MSVWLETNVPHWGVASRKQGPFCVGIAKLGRLSGYSFIHIPKSLPPPMQLVSQWNMLHSSSPPKKRVLKSQVVGMEC